MKAGLVKWFFIMRIALLCVGLLLAPSVAIAQEVESEILYLQSIRDYYPDNAFVQSSTDEALLVAGRQHCDSMREIGVRQHTTRVIDQILTYEERVGGSRLRDVLMPTLAVSQAALCPELAEAEGYLR